MGMRVIAGHARGIHMKMVPGGSTRPISDRAKGALFIIIGNDIIEASFLDLFAGTGSVGIEALSRGAKRAVFLDISREAVATIETNLAAAGCEERAEVLCGNAMTYVDSDRMFSFDYIYIAPPQYAELWSGTLTRVDKKPIMLDDDGWVVAQIHPREFVQVTLERLRLFDRRQYGSTMLCFYRLWDGREQG